VVPLRDPVRAAVAVAAAVDAAATSTRLSLSETLPTVEQITFRRDDG